ncbi:hypothetical protein PAMC26510_26520 [Caballeronia sordidicola]|uniref:Uncharacterized protein n=1 Tax=Caballeronia sordidicola TaxID=196367 RepID=A0A242MEM9_CABSO|nr:hypothetical protein PAMC26510_26520 [Caballeronia sordidicola]
MFIPDASSNIAGKRIKKQHCEVRRSSVNEKPASARHWKCQILRAAPLGADGDTQRLARGVR